MVIWHVEIKYMVDVGIFDVLYMYIYTIFGYIILFMYVFITVNILIV